LIVQDNAASRGILQEQVAAWGMVGGAAPGGPSALEALRAAAAADEPYDLVVLDARLQDVEALELARTIKAEPRLADTRLILLTSLGWGYRGAPEAAGIDAILTKPIRQSRLREALTRVLAGTRAVAPAPSDVVPAWMGAAPSEPPPGATTPAERAGPEASAAGRILVVEDAPINQTLALRMLAKLGYAADAVSNGREALAALARTPYSVVLMDCRLPEMDGFAATREIRQREGAARHTPIVAMTASGGSDERERCLEAGMDDYVAKPFRVEELAAVLERWAPRGDGAAPPEPTTASDGERAHENGAPPVVLDGAVFVRLEPEQVDQLVAMFLEDTPPRLAALRDAVADKDPRALREAAHYLRGIAMMMGLRELQGAYADLEAVARGGTTAGAQELLDPLEAAVQRATAALEARRVTCEP
jgi:CheY-like chemotaxis protein/HPt (histidine-containing phosphotransfer) domain-containing protein